MKNIIKERLGNIGTMYSGVRLGLKDKQLENVSIEKIKLFNWSLLKKYVEEQNIDGVPEYPIRTESKYKNGKIFLEQGDIVFSAFPVKNGDDNLIYIENVIQKKYMYGETMFVFRLNTEKYNSKYIYIMLNSGLYNNHISNINVGYSHRLKPQMILDIKIPILEKKQMDKICNDYDKFKDIERKLKKEKKDFWNNLNKVTNSK